MYRQTLASGSNTDRVGGGELTVNKITYHYYEYGQDYLKATVKHITTEVNKMGNIPEGHPHNIVPGVHCTNHAIWMFDEECIDLLWEDHLKACPEENHDRCGLMETGTSLYGHWSPCGMGYTPSKGGEYSAIYNPDYNTVQVVNSRYVIRCAHCSPCYPGQGDVDSDGHVWANCLPPSLMSKDWLKENGHRVFKWNKTRRANQQNFEGGLSDD